MKSDADRDLVRAVEALTLRRTFFTACAAEILHKGYSKDNSVPDLHLDREQRISPRERQIVQLVAEGKSSKEAASVLGISVKTAETHRPNLMRKLEVHSVSEIVRYAVKNRIIEA